MHEADRRSRRARHRFAYRLTQLTLLAVSLLAVQTGCAEQAPAPLARPDMTEGLVLLWVIGREDEHEQFVPTTAYRFEMTPEGRFAYTWQGSTASEQRRFTIRGAWAAVEGDARRWTLQPDDGRDALQAGEFATGEWPEIYWTNHMTAGISGPAAGATYVVPYVDPTTRRLDSGLTLVGDPRLGPDLSREMAERMLTEGP